MREQLLGYLLDALESNEREAVEQRLAEDPQLRRELELVYRSLEPLRADKGHYEAPPGLALRTCELVARAATQRDDAVTLAPRFQEPADVRLAAVGAGRRNRWHWPDLIVAGAVFFAASTLFFPALVQGRRSAELASCQNNLRQIGSGLTRYANLSKDRTFPAIPAQGNLGVAGVYAVRLVDGRFVASPKVFLCPSSATVSYQGEFTVPSITEVEKAQGTRLVVLQRRMGGDYGYSLGYQVNDRYQPPRDLRRPNYALVADLPAIGGPTPQVASHGGLGQNVLFEDGHVDLLGGCSLPDCGDNIYCNDQGMVAPGLHPDDSVIGPSSARPILIPVRGPAR